MRRRHDWPERLMAYVQAHRETPFEWGSHDCARFCAGAVQAMTDVDPMRRFRYKTKRGALTAINRHGSLYAATTATLGEPVAPLLAQRGDVVGFVQNGEETLGICVGGSVCSTGPEGLVFVPLRGADQAWRI